MSCLFCKMVAGEIPTNKVYENDQVLAFRDIHPVAPVHVLVIPKRHLASLGDASESDAGLLAEVMIAAKKVAELEGLLESGFRTIINTGRDANQTVHHLHVHVIGKRAMSWPPG